MKQVSLCAVIMGGSLVVVIAFGLLVSYSFAQTDSSSSSSTSVSESTTSSPDELLSSPSSTSMLEPITSASSDQSSIPSPTSSDQTSFSQEPIATSSDEVSSSNTSIVSPFTLTSTAESASSSAAPLPSPPPPPPAPTAYPICDQTIKNVPGDYPAIQAAIDAASIGDTIKVAAGTYNEDLTLKSGVCLEGAGIDQTIISKSGASGIAGNGVSYVIIKGLTVKNSGCAPGICGGGGDGGGIVLLGSNNVTVQSCRLSGNVAVNGGGMLVSGGGNVTVDHCLIDGNTARNIGGGMVVQSNSTMTLANVTVVNNVWSNPLGNGGVGGISFYGPDLQIKNSILWGNTSQDFSGNGSGISNSDIGGWSGGTANTSVDPNFTSDYRLQASSPVAGMGLY